MMKFGTKLLWLSMERWEQIQDSTRIYRSWFLIGYGCPVEWKSFSGYQIFDYVIWCYLFSTNKELFQPVFFFLIEKLGGGVRDRLKLSKTNSTFNVVFVIVVVVITVENQEFMPDSLSWNKFGTVFKHQASHSIGLCFSKITA